MLVSLSASETRSSEQQITKFAVLGLQPTNHHAAASFQEGDGKKSDLLQQRSRPSLCRTMDEYPSFSPLTSAGWDTLLPAGRISGDEQHHTAS